MNRLPHLAQRLFNRPLALLPAKSEVIVAALADRFGVSQMFHGSSAISLRPSDLMDDDRAPDRAYNVCAGVAIIPVQGTLVAKLGTLRPWSGMTGYDGIRLNMQAAMNDPDVDAIVLDVDSPGGEVAGCFDLADAIYAMRGQKPMHAILNEDAFSAAYAIASAADRITVPRTGGTGSVGVIVLHADLSQAMSKQGIAVTLIRYGDKKFEGNPYEALSAEALSRAQADVDAMGEIIVETVARNRGMTTAAVQATQGGTFLGAQGVSIGFADAVLPPDAAFSELILSLPN